MIIEEIKVSVREITTDYIDNDENGVTGYHGFLNIRPPFQREFVYNDKQRDEVINTVRKGFPLNTMYWAKSENAYELLDGQQRTVSICQYVDGIFSINNQYFENLTKEEKEQILNYKLTIYICTGTEREKLDWFRIVNIAGVELTQQELRNAVYTGTWLADAKRHFSKTGCPAYQIGKKYLKGSSIRQDYLETVLDWISNENIEKYMAEHQHDNTCAELWLYFQSVINWTKTIFPNYRKEMCGLDWGFFYNEHKNDKLDPVKLEEEVCCLMADKDVQKKNGVYEYVLTGDERCLNIRKFDTADSRTVYEQQKGVCAHCGKHFVFEEMEADHITPWSKGGHTVIENCQMLCKHCNRIKSNK